MSSGSAKRVSPKDIQVVQNLIERCLQLYMNQREVVETLLAQAKIDPGFTELVWLKLEEENPEFFKAYYLRLKLKHQIMEFNRLLAEQVRLMHEMNLTRAASMPTSNGSRIPLLHQNSALCGPEHTGPALESQNMHHHIGSGLTSGYSNGGSSLHSNMHAAVDMSAHANRIDASPNILSMQSSNLVLMQGMNLMVKSEAGYPVTSPYMFGAESSVLESRQPIIDSSVPSFSSVESSSQGLTESMLDADAPSFELHTLPRNFSLSDLTTHFAQSSELENYPRSPFLGTDNENLMDSCDREHEGDKKRLDSISEGVSYNDYGK